jgi:quercetin dioxygenase-like cupin family protein
MEKLSKALSLARVVRKGDCSVFKVLGASVEFLVGPQADDEAPCIIRGTMPPGVSVPVHSHKAVEVFFILSGNIEVLIEDSGKMSWVEASAGNLIEIPSKAKHAFRNSSQHPVVNLLYTTSEHGRYFQEIGRPATSGESVSPLASDEIQRLLKTAQRYGYWFATPEENASVGINLL